MERGALNGDNEGLGGWFALTQRFAAKFPDEGSSMHAVHCTLAKQWLEEKSCQALFFRPSDRSYSGTAP